MFQIVLSVLAIGIAVQSNLRALNESSFYQVREGMHYDEVVKVLGSPGDFRKGKTEYVYRWVPLFGERKSWINDSVRIDIFFDERMVVVWKRYCVPSREFDLIRDSLNVFRQ